MEEFTETWHHNASHWSIAVDGGLDWYDTKLRISSGSWLLWTTSFATTPNDSCPYHTRWYDLYYRFYTWWGTCP